MNSSPVNIQKYVQETIATVQNPQEYYSSMPTTGGFNDPLMRAAVFGAITGAIAFLMAFISFGGGGIGARFVSAITALIAYPVVAVVGIFVGGVFALVFSAIAGGSTDYEASTRVAASTVFLMPVQAVATFFVSINAYLGMAVSVAISLFAIYLFYVALQNALKANEKPTQIICGIFALLTVAGLFSSAAAISRANQAMQETQELIDQLQD